MKPDFANLFRKLIVVLATVIFCLRDGEMKTKSDLNWGPFFGLLVYLEWVNWVFRSFKSKFLSLKKILLRLRVKDSVSKSFLNRN